MGFYATESLPVMTDPHPKNRVGGFRTPLVHHARRFPAQVLEPHQEAVTLDSSTASGIVEWLSNDPIGISGGLNQYVFCANNPVNNVDPFGLDWLDTSANFAAGVGDVLSFNVTRGIRNSFPGAFQQDYNSGAYKGGEWTGIGYSLALGGGRLAYAGAAKGGSMLLLRQGAIEANAIKAVAYRNALKQGFNLGLTSNKARTIEWALGKYGSYAEIIKAAGRTNPGWNLLGGYLFSAGLTGLLTDDPNSNTANDQCK